jgi:hypothetical protein
MSKLGELRLDIEVACREIVQAFSEVAITPNEKMHLKLVSDEAKKECPDAKMIKRWVELSGLDGEFDDSECEDEDGDDAVWRDSLSYEIACDLCRLMDALRVAEAEALYSLQQEASLASTGPKSSLDH